MCVFCKCEKEQNQSTFQSTLSTLFPPPKFPNHPAGPSNVQISGPRFLTIGTPSVFTCSADCYPSCSYTWTVKWDKEVLETAEGNTISILPPPTVISETLICQAQSTVSHLYIATTVLLSVASKSKWNDLQVRIDKCNKYIKPYLFAPI